MHPVYKEYSNDVRGNYSTFIGVSNGFLKMINLGNRTGCVTKLWGSLYCQCKGQAMNENAETYQPFLQVLMGTVYHSNQMNAEHCAEGNGSPRQFPLLNLPHKGSEVFSQFVTCT